MNRSTLFAIAAGLVSALMLTVLLAQAPFGVLLVYFAPLPLYYVGLVYGLPSAAIAGVIGSLVLAADSWAAAAAYVFTFALPAVAVVRWALMSRQVPAVEAEEALEWYPVGNLVMGLTGLAAALFGGALLVGWASGLDLEAELQTTVGGLMRDVLPRLREGGESEFADLLVKALPSLAAASWIGLMAINGAIAQGLARKFKQNLRPSPALAEIRLPQWLAAAFIVALALALAPMTQHFVTATLAAILAMPFLFQGLGVVHWLAGYAPSRRYMLIGFYVLLIAARVLVFIIFILGVIEQWAELRRRYADATPG